MAFASSLNMQRFDDPSPCQENDPKLAFFRIAIQPKSPKIYSKRSEETSKKHQKQ